MAVVKQAEDGGVTITLDADETSVFMVAAKGGALHDVYCDVKATTDATTDDAPAEEE